MHLYTYRNSLRNYNCTRFKYRTDIKFNIPLQIIQKRKSLIYQFKNENHLHYNRIARIHSSRLKRYVLSPLHMYGFSRYIYVFYFYITKKKNAKKETPSTNPMTASNAILFLLSAVSRHEQQNQKKKRHINQAR